MSLLPPGDLSSLRGVLFDLDDTLVDRRAAHARAVSQLLEQRLGAATPEALATFDAADQDGLRPRGAFCARVVRALPELEWDAAQLWRHYAAAVAGAVRPVAGRRAALLALGEHLRLGVVTNGGARQREKLARADLEGLWSTVRVSAEEGCAKPDPRLFHRALADLQLEPHEVLFVGDRLHEDVGGARAVGLRSCWVRGPRTAPAPSADWIVANVDDALRALNRVPEAARCG